MPGATLFLGWSFTMVKSKGKKQIRWEYHSLVGGIPIPLKKNMSSSVGMIIYSQLNGNSLKKMFQTTNRYIQSNTCFTGEFVIR